MMRARPPKIQVTDTSPLLLFSFLLALFAWAAYAQEASHPSLLLALQAECKKELNQVESVTVTKMSSFRTLPRSEPSEVVIVGPHPPLGLVQFQVIWKAGAIPFQALVTAQVTARQKVVVVKTPVRHGEMLSSKKVTLSVRDTTLYGLHGHFSSTDQVQSRRAKGHLAPGTILTMRNTELPEAVKQGQVVELTRSRKGVVVRARMKALESGKIGDLIRVENPTSLRHVAAFIVAEGKVELK